MNHSHTPYSHRERGGAGVKFLIVAIIIILIANAGYNYVPAAYQGESFKQEMQTAVVQGFSLPSTYGKPSAAVKFKLENAARVNNLPFDAVIEVKESKKLVTARVYYAKKVQLLPFGAYEYTYVFDHTATPNGFLTQD